MKLKEIGEFGFIERFKPLFDSLVQENQMGIGDDCAIIPANDHEDWLITTDLLIEDVHFLRNAITPELLGYKSLAVNLSDIAAMGGTPIGSFLSIAIPSDVDVEYLDAFMDGYRKLSSTFNTPLLGGDTTKSLKHIAINVCVIGKCPKGEARKRGMAQIGDAICVTGFLGDSAGGLQVILNKLTSSSDSEYLISKHHRPLPRLKEGILLASNPEVHAMIDISDGITSDLKHILKASSVSANISINSIPISETLKNVAKANKWNLLDLAVSGGEDYELLFTMDKNQFDNVKGLLFNELGCIITQIGSIVDGAPKISFFDNGKEINLSNSGYNHFL